nr:heavy metal translocating P-type ATPase [Enterovirga sp. DB1703]
MPQAESSRRSRYRIAGMDCASCATKIENAVRRISGVTTVSVSATAGTLTVTQDGSVADAEIVSAVQAAGYKVTGQEGAASTHVQRQDHRGGDHDDAGEAGLHGHDHDDFAGPWWRSPKVQLTAACGFAFAIAYLLGRAYPSVDRWAFLVALGIGLVPVARRAFVALRLGIPFSIEMLMTVAAVGAVVIGATEEAAAVVFLFLVGELLEGVAAGRARASIQALTKLVPKTALVERGGRTEEIPAETLVVSQTVLVRPGDRIPADGMVVDGESGVDEAPVTGESVPKRKGVDDPVFAGTINGDGALRVRVTAAAKDNTIARVIRLVEEAQEAKAPTERFIDRFSRYYTPAVVIVAALVAVLPPMLGGAPWGEWIYKGLAILLIGCPCALVISTPAAIAAGLSAGARRGLLMKGGAVLESLSGITVAALDKTGTLTEGRPKVTDVIAFGSSDREVLSVAAALEAGSSHPLAKAILDKAAEAGVPVPPVSEAYASGGKGVAAKVGGASVFLGSVGAASERSSLDAGQKIRIEELRGEGRTVSVLVIDGRIDGLIAMRDEPRPDAKAGLERLRELGIRSIMVTGDNARTAAAIAATLDIEPRADLLPEDKQKIVRALQLAGEKVAKVGDGINDAPALAAANVGIAMGGGTDVALETAGAAVLHGRVADIARMIDLSRRTMANIRTNIGLSLGLKAVFLVTTILGVTGLWPAILADTGATVLVTANALRLLSARI